MGVFLWICAARWAFDVALPSLNVANACLPTVLPVLQVW
jgi:hypothetical protein